MLKWERMIDKGRRSKFGGLFMVFRERVRNYEFVRVYLVLFF